MSISHFKACCGGKLGIRKQIELYIKGRQSLDLFSFQDLFLSVKIQEMWSAQGGGGGGRCANQSPLDHFLPHAVFWQNVMGVSS